MSEANGNGINLKTPFGEITARGQFVLHVIMMVGLFFTVMLGFKDLRDSLKTDAAANMHTIMLMCQERQEK